MPAKPDDRRAPRGLPSAAAPAPTRCFRCGRTFGCGVATTGCWCTTLPRIDPVRIARLPASRRHELGLPEGDLPASCLCPDCLAELGRVLARGPGRP